MSDFNARWRTVPTKRNVAEDDLSSLLPSARYVSSFSAGAAMAMPSSPHSRPVMVSAPLSLHYQDHPDPSSHFDHIMSSAADFGPIGGCRNIRGRGGQRGRGSYNNNFPRRSRGGGRSDRRQNNDHNLKSFTKGLSDASTVFTVSNGYSISAPIVSPNMTMSTQSDTSSNHPCTTKVLDLYKRLYEDVVGATNVYHSRTAEWSIWDSEENSTIHKNWMNIVSYDPQTWHRTFCPITRHSAIAVVEKSSESSTAGSAVFIKRLMDEVSSLERYHNLEDINDPTISAAGMMTLHSHSRLVRNPYGFDRPCEDTLRAERRLVRVLSDAILEKHNDTANGLHSEAANGVSAETEVSLFRKRSRAEESEEKLNAEELATQSLFRNFVGNSQNCGRGRGGGVQNKQSTHHQARLDNVPPEEGNSSSDVDDFIEDLGAIEGDDDDDDGRLTTEDSVNYERSSSLKQAPQHLDDNDATASFQQGDGGHEHRSSLLVSNIDLLSTRDQYCAYPRNGGNVHLLYLLYTSSSPSSNMGEAPSTPELTCIHQLLAVHQDDLRGLAIMNVRFAMSNIELLDIGNALQSLVQVLEALHSMSDKSGNTSSYSSNALQHLFELALRPRLQTALARASNEERTYYGDVSLSDLDTTERQQIDIRHRVCRQFVRFVYLQSLVYLQGLGMYSTPTITTTTTGEEDNVQATTAYHDLSNIASTRYHYPISEGDQRNNLPLPLFSITGELLDDDDDATEEIINNCSGARKRSVNGEIHYLHVVRMNSPQPTSTSPPSTSITTHAINRNIAALNSILRGYHNADKNTAGEEGSGEDRMPALLRLIHVPSPSSAPISSSITNQERSCHPKFASPSDGLLSQDAIHYYESFEGVPWIGSDTSAFPVHLRRHRNQGPNSYGSEESSNTAATVATTLVPVWCYEVFSCRVAKSILKESLVSSAVQLIAMGASVDMYNGGGETNITPHSPRQLLSSPSSTAAELSDNFGTVQCLATELELVLKKKPSQVTIHKSLLTTISELFKLLTEVDEDIMQQAQTREDLLSRLDALQEECKKSLQFLDERVLSLRVHEEGNRARDAAMRPLEDTLKALSKELARPSADDKMDVRDLCKKIRDYFAHNPTSILKFLQSTHQNQNNGMGSSTFTVGLSTTTTLKKGHGAIQSGARNLALTSSNAWAFRIFDPLRSGRLDCVSVRTAIAATTNAEAYLSHHQQTSSSSSITTTTMSSILRVLEDLGRVPDIRRSRGSDIPYTITN